MTDLIAKIGEVLTAVIGWIGEAFTMISTNDLFMVLILIPIAFGVIFLVVRIIMSIRSRAI